MKKVISITALAILCFTSSISSASIPPSYSNVHSQKATKLFKQVAKLKDKFYLEYKDDADLMETCSIITKYSKYSKHFDEYDIATIVLIESRFNSKAINHTDGGQGLMQLTGIKKWHKTELFWITLPLDKEQNIKGGIIVLEEIISRLKNKTLTITRYNGFSPKSKLYLAKFIKTKELLKNA